MCQMMADETFIVKIEMPNLIVQAWIRAVLLKLSVVEDTHVKKNFQYSADQHFYKWSKNKLSEK